MWQIPFLGSFNKCSHFKSSGRRFCSQIIFGREFNNSVHTWTFAVSDLRALVNFYVVGRSVLIPGNLVGGLMSRRTGNADLFSVTLKCSAHIALCSASSAMEFPSSSSTEQLGLTVFPESVRIISYCLHVFSISSRLLLLPLPRTQKQSASWLPWRFSWLNVCRFLKCRYLNFSHDCWQVLWLSSR